MMATIQIMDKAYEFYTTIYGDDNKLIGQIISREIAEREKIFIRLRTIRSIMIDYAGQLEDHCKLETGFIMTRKGPRLDRADNRAVYRYIVAIVVRQKFKYGQSEIMKAIGIKHCNFTYGNKVVESLYECYPEWKEIIDSFGKKVGVKIM